MGGLRQFWWTMVGAYVLRLTNKVENYLMDYLQLWLGGLINNKFVV